MRGTRSATGVHDAVGTAPRRHPRRPRTSRRPREAARCTPPRPPPPATPGTARTGRPCSSAKSAVMSAPDRSPASTTTTASAMPATIRLRAGNRHGAGSVPGPVLGRRAAGRHDPVAAGASLLARMELTSTPHPSTANVGAPAASAPSCASASIPSASPLSTIAPRAASDDAERPGEPQAERRRRGGCRRSRSTGTSRPWPAAAAPTVKSPNGGSVDLGEPRRVAGARRCRRPSHATAPRAPRPPRPGVECAAPARRTVAELVASSCSSRSERSSAPPARTAHRPRPGAQRVAGRGR